MRQSRQVFYLGARQTDAEQIDYLLPLLGELAEFMNSCIKSGCS